jgi:hypothetical protein
MCIRCQEGQAPEPLGLCAACVLQTRVEISAGLRRLQGYLDAWAAFQTWLAETGRA